MVRRPAIALAVAGLGVLGMLVDYVLAFHVGAGQEVDRRVLDGFTGFDQSRIGTLAERLPHLSDPQPFVLFVVLIVAVALVRGRPRLALGAAVITLGANVTTQWLKPPLSTPRAMDSVGPPDLSLWPSGHATASMSLCLAAVLVAPRDRRPLVAGLGAVYSLAVVFALLVGAWHFPSDVLAGYLMAGTWTAVVVAALWAVEGRSRAGARPEGIGLGRAVAPAGLMGLTGIAVATGLVLARPAVVTQYAREHTTFVIGAGLLALVALALAAGLSVALTTGSARAPTAAPHRRWRRARG